MQQKYNLFILMHRENSQQHIFVYNMRVLLLQVFTIIR